MTLLHELAHHRYALHPWYNSFDINSEKSGKSRDGLLSCIRTKLAPLLPLSPKKRKEEKNIDVLASTDSFSLSLSLAEVFSKYW